MVSEPTFMSVVDVANAISIVLMLNVILLFFLRSLALNIIPVLPESDAESVFKMDTTHSLEFNKPEQNEPVLAKFSAVNTIGSPARTFH